MIMFMGEFINVEIDCAAAKSLISFFCHFIGCLKHVKYLNSFHITKKIERIDVMEEFIFDFCK